jgi:murein DD-endopeptidase MepM/ murein hydrolase activator NlpD
MMRRALILVALLAGLCRSGAAERIQLVWPTPNTAWAEGKPLEAYIQHAGSGDPESGTFGGVRSGGRQFHEGIDIKCVSRDRHGEPTDDVFAAMDGVVRHINHTAGDSNYGRYIVLEHPDQTPAVYTLYAHLSRIAPGLQVGQRVAHGAVIATMGHSSDRPIPRDRAHLHFEIGVMVTRDFESWYERQKYGSRNEQGLWNGMNLMGLDPLAVFNGWRAGRIVTLQDVFAQQPVAVRLKIATHRMPDFVARYPSLVTKPLPMGPVSGWEIAFNWTGVPVAWTPLSGTEIIGLGTDMPQIVEVNAEIEHRERSKSLAVARRGHWVPGKDLETVLQQLFGLGRL